MIAQPAVTVCPYCGKDDRIQRARAYPHPRLTPPLYIEAPKPAWNEPNRSLRLMLASLLALTLGLLIMGVTQVDDIMVWSYLSGGAVMFIAALILLGVMRARRTAALRHYDVAMGAWTQRVGAERRRWQIAQARWENDLFYCHRDDVVFFRGSPAVRPEQMRALLY
jgi:hypothetical protein